MNTPKEPSPSPDEPSADAMDQAEAIINDALARDGAEVSIDDGADPSDPLEQAQAKAAEHLEDLQRLQAEFVNYRKRVDRDRAQAAEVATARLVETLIPTLDDIAAAREHGDLEGGPFAAIADKLEESLSKFGWSRYGAVGDVFDPARHEALMSQTSPDATEATVTQVAQPGHAIGDKVIRAARVIVIQPE